MKKLVFLCFAAMFLSLNAQNYCLDFDGVDDYISVTSSTVVQGAFTVEAWVKPMHPTDNLNILSTRSGSDNSFDMKLMSGNKIHGDIGNGTSWLTNTADGDFEYATGTWYHIAYSVSADTGYEIFANGTSVGSGTLFSASPLLMDATHQINIGRYNGGLEYFKGCIDEVRVWNVARTGQEIRDNMLKPLLGTETGLVAYYGFNEASGMTAGDNAGSNDGTLTNMAEEDWALSFCFNPQIKSLSPADNSLNVSLSENLEITFDKAILAGTGSIVIHKSSDDSIVETIPAISCAIVDSIVTIDPSSDFEYFTDYYVLIDNTAFMDNESAYFEGIAEKTVWNFNSKAVVYVIGTSPADNSQNVSLSENLEITFNKNIFAGSGNVVIHKSSDDSIVETIPANSCTIGRSKVTIDPSNDFEILTDFYVLIDSNAFMDSGSTYYNGITEKTVWNFTSQNYFTEINTSLTGVIYSSVEWGDYDNDGDLDILLTGNGISKIYRNDAGTFTDVAAELIGVSDCSSALGDYDNDGDLDILLTGNSIYGPISKIFRNNGGTFFDIAAVLTGVMHGSSAWGDYDNDGDLDILLTGDTNAGYISKIYRNDAGIFIDINAVLIGVVDGSSEWGDFDNDGYLDLIITGYTGSERISKIYRNNAGVFIDIGAGLPGVSLSSVAWGDYDNDSDLDLIISGTIGFGWFSRIYRNDSGMFANIGAGFTEVFNGSAEWGDYDNDGDLDILLTGYKAEGFSGGGVSRIYRNDSGMFIDISAGLTDVYKGSSAWGDYDNDGDLDILLTGSSGAGYVSKVYRNNSLYANNPPAAPANLSAVVTGYDAVLSWNKSTDTETPQNGLTYNVYIGTASHTGNIKDPMSNINNGYRKVVSIGNINATNTWSIKNLPVGKYYWSIQAVDNTFAGSGFGAESFFITAPAAPVALEETNVRLTEFTANWQTVENASGYCIDVSSSSDFSTTISGYNNLNIGDNLSCVVTGLNALSTYYYRVRAYNTSGTSPNSGVIESRTLNFFTEISSGLDGVEYSSSTWGDYDNDGDLDMIVTGYTGSVNIAKIFRNNAGVFSDIGAALTGVQNGSSAWGDYDNDGDLDLTITGYTGSANIAKIYRNNAGVFTDITAGLAGVRYGTSAWGDYDNDGDLDLMITGTTGTVNTANIYRNDAGVFNDISAGLTGVYQSSSAWGDYDNDGDLDVLLTGDTGAGYVSKIYRNNTGVFTDIAAGLAGVYYGSSAWGDYDNDGDLDLMITGNTGSSKISKIYRNDSGTFNDINATLSGVYLSSVAWGDYDNDGDPDILLAGFTGSEYISKIYSNNSCTFTDINAGLTGVVYCSSAWGDYDNDGDLDLLLTGEIGAGYVSKIYRNNCATPNTAPGKPGKLTASMTDQVLHLSFNPSIDSQTPQAALSYNIDIAVNGQTITPTMSDVSNGFRKIVQRGNITNNRNYYLHNFPENLPQEEKSVTWKVQAIDNCFAGSEFTSTDFVLSSPRDLILSSNISMTENDVLKWESINAEITDHYVIQIDDDSYFTSPFEKIYNFEKNETDSSKDKILYLFMPLNEFDEINEFEDQKVYYWRMKPVYSDLSKVTLFSENSRNFKFVIATYYPPSSISITAVTNTITVSWVAKKDESKGTAYKVYSSVNPYAEFPAGWTYEATVSGTEWVTTASNAKKFYCVTTTGATKDVIQKEVEETVISK